MVHPNRLKALLVLVTVCICASACWAGISITPAFVETTIDTGRPAGQFLIANLGETEERFRIQAIHFVFSQEGALKRIPPDEHSLASWIKFNPREFSLPPKSKRAIRYVIIPRGNLKTGEYWGAMELESLQTQISTTKDTTGHEVKVEVISSILVPIWGKVGHVRYQGILKEAGITPADKGTTVRFSLLNTGDGRLLIQEGNFAITNEAGEQIGKGALGKFYLLPEQELSITHLLESSLAPGRYKLHIQCQSPQLKEPFEGEFPLTLK